MQREYNEITELLAQYGEVSSPHIADHTLPAHGEIEYTEEQIYQKEIKRLTECDVVVAEVTTPSLGVGYLLALAELQNKKVVCLFQGDPAHKLSAMILGNASLTVHNYSSNSELKEIFDKQLG